MIIVGSYEIEIAVAETIDALAQAGQLENVVPDDQYGFTCEVVYGMSSDAIAAVHLDASRTKVRYFQLTDGRLMGTDPEAAALVMPPRPVTPN